MSSAACVASLALLGLAVTASSSAGPGAPLQDKIAFLRNDTGVYVMNADGSAQRKVSRGSSFDFDWSPDGRRLAILDRGGIEVVEIDGTGRRRVLSKDAVGGGIDWSPVGDQLLWHRDGYLLVLHADGTGLRLLTRTAAWDAAWSPDGRRIAFADGRYLYVMKSDGTEQRRLARGKWLTGPAWSPDGKTVAFQRLTSGATHYWQESEIYEIGADGTGKRILTARFPYDAQEPVWSPDGGRILFECIETCSSDGLYLLNPRTGAHRRLARGRSADWSPDGREIAYRAFVKNNYEIFVMTAQGGAHTNLTRTRRTLTDGHPRWAPRKS